ncbi:MAG TPA: bacterioferritin [Anaerolineaceae bacterium]|nr:bacterioferritin [Anaerolineaceae bacterium]
MKGNLEVLKTLNNLLSDELTAISQYMVHSSMNSNWGYGKLHDAVEKRAIDEMKHAEMLIDRILFLEGEPVVSDLKKMCIGPKVDIQLADDLESEIGAVKAYNDAIRLAGEKGDNGTRDLFISILKDEEAHLDWLETQLEEISQMGIQNYLVMQVE